MLPHTCFACETHSCKHRIPPRRQAVITLTAMLPHTMPQHGVPPRRPGFAPYRAVVLDDRRAGCPSCWMTAVLAKCVAASPGKQNKEPCCFAWQAEQGARARLRCCVAALPGKRNQAPVQDCVLLLYDPVVLDDRRACQVCCCLPWQAKQGARARLRSAALLLCLASVKRRPCKTAFCCVAAVTGKRKKAPVPSPIVLLPCLASAKRRPCKTAFCCVAALPGKREKEPVPLLIVLR